MSGSQMFVMYTSEDGNNVTVSPRLGSGNVQPRYNSDAQITLLEGSGVSDGIMTANVRCSSCSSWSGGDMDFSSTSSSWIYALRSGSALDSDELDENISQHNSARSFTWELAAATGGDGTDPFASASGSGSATDLSDTDTVSCTPIASATSGVSNSPTDDDSASGRPTDAPWDDDRWDDDRWGGESREDAPWNDGERGPWNDHNRSKRQSSNSCPEGQEPVSSTLNGGNGDSSDGGVAFSNGTVPSRSILVAHGVIASLAFVLLFPVGGILIRLFSFRGLIWVHAGLQAVTYVLYIVAFGLGIYMANTYNLMDRAHVRIGIVLLVVLLAQPILGVVHHKMFKKHGKRTVWSQVHIWLGRIIIPLGMINGGLGLELAANASTDGHVIAYAVCAAVMGVAYIVAIVLGERKRRKAAANVTPPSYENSQMRNLSRGNNPFGAGGSDDGNNNREYYSSMPKQHPSR